MRFCAAVLLVMATPLVAAGVRLGPRKTFCGISVRAPRGYIVEQYDDHGHCGIGMKPNGWNEDPSEDAQEDGDYAITLDIAAENLEDAARDAGIFQVKSIRVETDDGKTWPTRFYRDDEWVTMGVSGFGLVQPIERKSWTGLIGGLLRTFYHRHGGHSGMGEIVVAAVVSRQKPPIAVIMHSGALQADQARAVIQAVQILPRR